MENLTEVLEYTEENDERDVNGEVVKIPDNPDNKEEIQPRELDHRDYNELTKAIALADHDVFKRYLPQLHLYSLATMPDELAGHKTEDCIRLLKLEKFTHTKDEDVLQKLSMVYHATMELGGNLIVLLNVARLGAPVDIYLGVKYYAESGAQKANRDASLGTLFNGLKTQFPGSSLHLNQESENESLLTQIFDDHVEYISSVSCVASIRDKQKTEEKKFIQGIEKLIDTMKGEPYTALFIAEPILFDEQAQIRQKYQDIYTAMVPFAKTSWSFNEENGTSVMHTVTQGASKAINESVSRTTENGFNVGISFGGNMGQQNSHTDSSPTKAARTGQALTAGLGSAVGLVGTILTLSGVGTGVGIACSVIAGALGAAGGAISGGSFSDNVVKSFGGDIHLNGGYSHSTAKTDTQGVTDTEHRDESDAEGSQHSLGRTIQIENANKMVEELLKRIEENLKRVKECEDFGGYKCGAYFLSAKQENALLAANTYRALMLGEGSSVESGAVNIWSKRESAETVSGMKEYLKQFEHPQFKLLVYDYKKQNLEEYGEDDYVFYSPATIVSGSELPLHLGLPTKSVYGLPVVEHAEFGRNIYKKYTSEDGRKLDLGNIYHMGRTEKSPVQLDFSELTAHTFITGSTGSGKTNTVCKMLEEFDKKGVNFLVVEPAKGEYKNYFGGKENVSVYGTNSKLTPMLKINPFSFPTSIHVLEHLDRLVEIFNVCWPMYAAMPAVLKNAIEKSYEDCGWNLVESENPYGKNLYPCFADVARNVKAIIDSSEYDKENKGAYKGALVTRLRDLTNGINGLIFSDDEIPMNKFFNENVIVDLSRVGSNETKSLIMGMLVLKLQEHRMASEKPDNKHLNHVTVLEEAHNLLKRTSTEQSSESSNLLGKSVEMLANSIAEMRTYGEGFIIADQAPGLLDMSVIRNTNTKIIMRLPDLSDRELVGKAAGLNDEQIIEIGKFELGVAAVMQSGWLEPVLCKVDECKSKYPLVYEKETKKKVDVNGEKMTEIATYLSKGTKIGQEILTKEIMPYLKDFGVPASVRVSIFKQLEHPTKEIRMTKLAPMMSALFPEVKKAVISAYDSYPDACEWTRCAEEALSEQIQSDISDQVRRDIIQAIITQHIFIERRSQADIERWAKTGGLR